MAEQLVLALDLDDVLFDTALYKKLLIIACQELGISEEEYEEKYVQAKQIGYFNRDAFIHNLVRTDLSETTIRATFARVLKQSAMDLVYNDAKELLDFVRRVYPEIRLALVTRGCDFQLDKVDASGLRAYFRDQIYIVNVQSKATKIEELLTNASRVVFVDNDEGEIDEVNQYFESCAHLNDKVRCVWLNRYKKESKSKSKSAVPKIEVNSLKQLQSLLPQFFYCTGSTATKSNFGPFNLMCFGGGTGLPMLLEGLRTNAWWKTITAVVTMFDSGGRSGKLRDQYNALPPSDILRCMLALSPVREEIQKYFFTDDSSGCTLGHMFMVGGERTSGFLPHLRILKERWELAENHCVLPVALELCHLGAVFNSFPVEYAYSEVGVDEIMKEGNEVGTLFLQPADINCNPDVISAIERADVLCVGPGSFYTSLLPNFLPHGVKEAIQASSAPIIFIANLFTEGAGMQRMTLEKIVEVAEGYMGRKIDLVVYNDALPDLKQQLQYKDEGKKLLHPSSEEPLLKYLPADLLWTDKHGEARHNASRLAHVVWHATRSLLNNN